MKNHYFYISAEICPGFAGHEARRTWRGLATAAAMRGMFDAARKTKRACEIEILESDGFLTPEQAREIARAKGDGVALPAGGWEADLNIFLDVSEERTRAEFLIPPDDLARMMEYDRWRDFHAWKLTVHGVKDAEDMEDEDWHHEAGFPILTMPEGE